MSTKQVVPAVSLLVLAICLYVVGSSFFTAQHTGLLEISSSDKKALLTISQDNHEAKVVGIGRSKILLNPGVYQVAATDGTKQQFTVVQVYKRKVTNTNLEPSSTARIPTPQTIVFSGTSALINSGLTVNQVSALKQAFFKYKSSAQSIVINQSSVEPGPHNPNGIGFTINFTVAIDSKLSKAAVSYSGLNDIRLYLYDPQNNSLVFDSGVIQD